MTFCLDVWSLPDDSHIRDDGKIVEGKWEVGLHLGEADTSDAETAFNDNLKALSNVKRGRSKVV